MQALNDSLRGRDFISIHDYTPEEIAYILEVGAILKKSRNKESPILTWPARL